MDLRTGSSPRRSPWPLFEVIAHGMILFGLVFFADEIVALDLRAAAGLTSLVTLFAAVVVMRSSPRGIWSPSAVYVAMFALFHCGLVAAYSVGHEPTGDLGTAARMWLDRPSTRTALWLTSLAACGYAIGVRLAHVRGSVPHRPGPSDDSVNTVTTALGVSLLIGSILLWFAVVLRRGPGLLVGSYHHFLAGTEGSVLPFAYNGLAFGLVFLAASRWSRWHRAGIIAYAAWSLVALPLGLRGEMLFPLVAALSVVAIRRIPARTSRAALLAVGVLSLMALIRNVRAVGLEEVGAADLGLNPLDGMVEMGASLRPVSEVVFWHDMGDDFDRGATYWAPIDRALFYVIPGWQRLPAKEDHRIMNVLVMQRVGPIGFSPVAEAYRNFAAPGAFGVLFLFGLVLGRIDTWPDTRLYQCVAGVVLTGLLFHVRNSFVPLPSYLTTGFVMVAAIALVGRARSERPVSSSPAARAGPG